MCYNYLHAVMLYNPYSLPSNVQKFDYLHLVHNVFIVVIIYSEYVFIVVIIYSEFLYTNPISLINLFLLHTHYYSVNHNYVMWFVYDHMWCVSCSLSLLFLHLLHSLMALRYIVE